MTNDECPTRKDAPVGGHLVGARGVALVVVLGLGLLLFGCSGKVALEAPPASDLDQMPLALARHFFLAGYELAGYHELDADSDGIVETLAVLTLRLPLAESFLGDSYVLLFGQHGGAWSLTDGQQLNGVNASAELRDLTGDGLAELLVFTEEADAQPGDFVAPLRYTDHLSVFTYVPGLHLVELGTFSSSLSGVMRPHSTVGEWEGRPAIQTARDLPPAGIPLWWPFHVETFAWDGQGFASVQVQERRRISPIVSWLVRRNAPWAAAFLVLGGVLSLVPAVIVRRSRLGLAVTDPRLLRGLPLQERWVILGLALLLVASGVGLGLIEEWLCVPALILVGLAGLGIGRRFTTRLVTRSNQGAEVESGE
jgi:hypothetical protein